MGDFTLFGITFSFSGLVIPITLIIFFVFLVILVKRLSNSMKANTENNGRINQYLAAVPADRLGTVNSIYQNTRKSVGTGLILSLVGGIFGIQRVYLGKRTSSVFMFLFFWTGIPAIISLFDMVGMPRTVSEYNLTVVRSLYDQIAAPKLNSEDQ